MLNEVKFSKIILMKLILFCGLAIAVLVAAVFLFLPPRNMEVPLVSGSPAGNSSTVAAASLPVLPEAPTSSQAIPGHASSAAGSAPISFSDIENQQQLPNPPAVARGVYMTGWSAGYAPKVNYIINLAKRTEINAVVVDIKDYSGYVSYRTTVPVAKEIGAEGEIRIAQPNALLKKLHDAGIYVIGRITVFQDPILAKAHPEWALQSSSTGKIWTDNKGLAWMDAAAEPVWEYNVAIAKDAIARGFDEVQFDYVRFASDGNMSNIKYPYWDKKTARHKIIASFFKYLRENLGSAKMSADLFGYTTTNVDDLGIGQVIEDAYKYFDYISPMVYPSHYNSGFLGYASPAKHPYEVIKYSMERAIVRLANQASGVKSQASSSSPNASGSPITSYQLPISKLRPWLQDFDLGATYDAAMVKQEMQAVEDVLVKGSISLTVPVSATSTASGTPAGPNVYTIPNAEQYYGGWLLWDPANIYTEGALEHEP